MLQKYDRVSQNCNILKFKHFSVKTQIVTEMSYFCNILKSRMVFVKSALFTQNLHSLNTELTYTILTKTLHKINIGFSDSLTRACARRPLWAPYKARASWKAASWKLRAEGELHFGCYASKMRAGNFTKTLRKVRCFLIFKMI